MANELQIYNDPNGIVRWEIPQSIMLALQEEAEFDIEMQEHENNRKLIKEGFLKAAEDYFEKTGIEIKSIELPGIGTITFRAPHIRTTLSQKEVKENYPEVYKQCSKTQNIGRSVVFNFGE